MIAQNWMWKSVVAGSAATVVHFLFMYFKSRIGSLPGVYVALDERVDERPLNAGACSSAIID
jgi:hypothetical protein